MSEQLQFIPTKQIHECTVEEYAGPEPPERCWTKEQFIKRWQWEDERTRHHAIVCIALDDGLPVPDEVLTDYPWLRNRLDCSRWKRRYPVQWEAI